MLTVRMHTMLLEPAFHPVMVMKNLDLTQLSVLVVEKHPPMRSMFRGILRELGIRKIDDAASPETGFEEFNRRAPDLVLVDWSPGFDGIGLLQKIRTDKDSNDPFAPVIMVTAHGEADRVIEARDAGMTEYLTKPISAKGLYQRIASIVESKRPFIRVSDFFGPDRRRKKEAFGADERREGAKTPDKSPDETPDEAANDEAGAATPGENNGQESGHAA